jgi:hypothetical protein
MLRLFFSINFKVIITIDITQQPSMLERKKELAERHYTIISSNFVLLTMNNLV